MMNRMNSGSIICKPGADERKHEERGDAVAMRPQPAQILAEILAPLATQQCRLRLVRLTDLGLRAVGDRTLAAGFVRYGRRAVGRGSRERSACNAVVTSARGAGAYRAACSSGYGGRGVISIESPFYMTRSVACAVMLTAVSVTLAAQQGQPQIGIAPVTLTAGPYSFDTAEQHRLKVTIVARGLAHPFSLAFLPNGDALVTERGVRLRVIRGATGAQAKVDADPVAGLPQMPTFRTGGLHEIALHPKFASNGFDLLHLQQGREVEPDEPAAAAERDRAGARQVRRQEPSPNVQDLFVGNWNNGASGSRLAFGPDGLIYITTGAPFGDQAQDTNSVYGKVLRLRDDGTVPPDNPFVGKQGYRPEVFSMGHRDQLGLTIHPSDGCGAHRGARSEWRRRSQRDPGGP